MADRFSTRVAPLVIDCAQPDITISFPVGVAPGPGSVVLANGAVVNLAELGQILSQFCPAFVCPGAVPSVPPVVGTPGPVLGSPAIQTT